MVSRYCQIKCSGDFFTSRLLPQDFIPPVVTFVLYFGEEPWFAPLSLPDLTGKHNILKSVEPLMQKCSYRVIDMRAIPQDLIDKMQSELKLVAQLIKRGISRDEKLSILQKSEFKTLKPDLVLLINELTGLEVQLTQEDWERGEVNMETLKQMFYQEGYNQAAAKFEKENENNLKNAAAKFEKENESNLEHAAIYMFKTGQSSKYISEALNKPVSVIEQWIFNDKNGS